MHPHLLLLLLSSGVSSCFLSLKEMPHLLNETKYSLIDEMLCLLEAEEHIYINERFVIPSERHIKELCCAHINIELFIHQLKKIPPRTCMGKMEKGMEKLEKNCCILKKSSTHNSECLKAETDFSRFKESLKEFLRWVNGISDCSSVGRSELDSYLDNKCSCPDLWKSHRALGKEELPRH